jgi:hypothetical protein
MSIDSIGSAATSVLSPVRATDPSASSSTPTATVDDADPVDSRVSLSGPAQLFRKLQSLEQTDPSQAQDTLRSLADKLREQAKSTTGQDATRLNAFADKLDKAADTGDLSELSPAKHGGHGGHHHHGGAAPATSDDTSTSNPVTAAYAKQQALGSDPQDKTKSFFDQLNAAVDSITAI